jgi:hypothetical protein
MRRLKAESLLAQRYESMRAAQAALNAHAEHKLSTDLNDPEADPQLILTDLLADLMVWATFYRVTEDGRVNMALALRTAASTVKREGVPS